jgi:hypothetical protein
VSAGRRYRRQIRGGSVLYVLPEIRDADHPAIKEALAIRNIATRTLRCPSCLAGVEFDGPIEPGKVTDCWMAHEDWCPASNDRLAELVERYGRPS